MIILPLEKSICTLPNDSLIIKLMLMQKNNYLLPAGNERAGSRTDRRRIIQVS